MGLLARAWSAPTLLIAACALFWSANSVVGRAAHGVIGPIALSFWRWAVAAMLMGLLARRHVAADWPAVRANAKLLIAASVFGVGLFGTLLYIALGYTTAVNGVLMQSALPAVTMLMLLVGFGERPPRRALVGSVLAILGVLLIVCRGSPAALVALRLNVGDAITLFATILYASYSIMVSRGPRLNPLVFATVTFSIAATALLPAWAGEILLVDGPPFGPGALAAILFVAIVPSCAAYLCYNRAIALAGPAAAGNVTLLMPVFGAAMAVLFLGERIAWFHIVGGIVILAGILLARSRPTSPRTPAR